MIRLLLLIVLASCCRCLAINIESCSNFYSPDTKIPEACTEDTCDFTSGLQSLVDNLNSSYTFMLCLSFPNYTITVSPQQHSVDEIFSLYIEAGSIIFNQQYEIVAKQYLVLLANETILFNTTTITALKVWMQAQIQIEIISSVIINENFLETNCSCVEGGAESCKLWTFKYPQLYTSPNSMQISLQNFEDELSFDQVLNNSVTMFSYGSISIEEETKIKFSVVGIFALNVSIESSNISSADLGFGSGSGQGCGYFDELLNQLLGCKGSGGSHGGFGGNSSPENCYLLVSNPPYGSIEYPYEPGSGGGFFIPASKESSSGGGVINIQGSNFNFNNVSINANGKNGIQGGGGGAGGSISLDYVNMTAVANISANGGNGDRSSSGSGGRIRLWNHNWQSENLTISKQNLNLMVSVIGGGGCPNAKLSCGQNGSVYTSPCRPGSQLNLSNYICTPCLSGFYQLTYGYSPCLACGENPANSSYPQGSINNYSACDWGCDVGLLKYNGKCLNNFDYVYEKYYGFDIALSLAIIAFAFFVYLIVIIFRKISEKQKSVSHDSHLDSYSEKRYFRLEDLPYHEIRLYCEGENHPFNPWKITDETKDKFFNELKNPVSRVTMVLEKAIKSINMNSEYSRFEIIVIFILRFTYYPVSRVALEYMRKRKVQKIMEEISKINKKRPDFETVGIKFHVKPQLTVASLQIFNYSKSMLDFYIENYSPLFLMLEKAPFGGYYIDFTDPFLKVFLNEASERDKNLEQFFKKLNSYMKSPHKSMSMLNYLWSIRDTISSFEIYLWQPPDIILGVEKEYKIDQKKPLFLMISSENINNNHFMLNEVLPSFNIPEIDYLRHKFNIRKEISGEDERCSPWILQNSFSEKFLLWVFGIATALFVLLMVASFLFMILPKIICSNDDKKQMSCEDLSYELIVYFALWPLCDLFFSILSIKTIFNKSEYFLANSISFNIITFFKVITMFIYGLCLYIKTNALEYQIIVYIWIVMLILSACIYIVQIMLREKLIATQEKQK